MKIRMTLDPTPRSARARTTAPPRHRGRPAFESLETRRLLSTIMWDGAGDGTSFASGKNWVGGIAPGIVDDAVINVSSTVNIQLPAGTAEVNSLTQGGGRLTMAGGSFTTQYNITLTGVAVTMTSGKINTKIFSLTNGTFDDEGGTIQGYISDPSPVLDNSTLDNGPNATGSFYIEGASTLNGPVTSNEILIVLSPDPLQPASLTVASGFVNRGKIDLSNFYGLVPAPPLLLFASGGQTFTNAGTIQCGANNTLAGRFLNQGEFDIEGGTTTLSPSSSLLNQGGGLVSIKGVPGGTTLDVSALGSSVVNQKGGTIDAGGVPSFQPCTVETSPGSFVNAGTLSMTSGPTIGYPGELTIQGDYTQAATGTLGVLMAKQGASGPDIAGRLDVTGTANLAGSVAVKPAADFQPVGTDTFEFLTFGSSSGAFSAYSGTTFGDGLTFRPLVTSTSQTLTAGPVPLADLVVGVTTPSKQVTVGGDVTYVVSLANLGPDAAQGVTLTDLLPQGAPVVSVAATSGTPTTSGGVVTLDLASLASGSSDALTIVVAPATTGAYADSASVVDAAPFDPNPANDAGSATSTVVPPPSADLTVQVAPPPASTTTGLLGFTLTVTNNGPSPAMGSTLLDEITLPAGARLASESVSQGSLSVSGGVVTANLGTIPAGAVATLTVVVAITANGTLADLSSINAATADPNLGNNLASFGQVVQGEATITLTPSSQATTPKRPVTLSAQVSVPPGYSAATGSVTFHDGPIALGSAKVDAKGHASLVVTLPATGTHSLSAAYSGDPNYSATKSTTAGVRVINGVVGDFDGDGKADVAIFDQTTATFAIDYSGGGSRVQQLGNNTHVNIPVLGDFDGDGKTDLAVFDQTASVFYILYSGGGSLVRQLGNNTHVNIPVAGDFDGDGKADLAVFDQTSSVFLIQYSGGGSLVRQLGNNTHLNIPVAGDFDGDGKADVAVFDQTASVFLIQYSGGGSLVRQLGNNTHVNIPVAGDFDGDGKTDLAVYDQTASTFLVLESGGGTINRQLGTIGHLNLPVASDFDGDGKTDLAVYDQTAAVFLVLDSGGGSLSLPFGDGKHKNLPA